VIAPPKRAVTRFLIPFIDVLILLFCIFLLMPFVSSPEDALAGPPPAPTVEVPKDTAELQRQLNEAKRRVEQMRKDRTPTADKMSVRVLEIDQATGKLFAFEPDAANPRQEVKDHADAQRLIDRQRRAAGTKDVFFLILYPRELTGYPLQSQIDAYRGWFKDVPHGFDNPWAGGE